jgi:hypothetical protein
MPALTLNLGSVRRLWRAALLVYLAIAQVSWESHAQSAKDLIVTLRGLGHGKHLFGQVATWVHNENPDPDHPGNWVRKVRDHTGRLPAVRLHHLRFRGQPLSRRGLEPRGEGDP